jgi:alpha-tubulin suppressor-like RCC1 family protein
VVQSSKCWQMDLQVVAMAGMDHTLIVNGNGELYITSGKDELSDVYRNIPLEPQSSLRLILSQLSTNRILQISANWSHAAFVTETGQVTKSFMFLNHGSETLS